MNRIFSDNKDNKTDVIENDSVHDSFRLGGHKSLYKRKGEQNFWDFVENFET